MKDHIISMVQERAVKYAEREVFRHSYINKTDFKSITWNQLLHETGNVSKALIHHGFKDGDKIGIFSDNRPEWVISDLGILGIRGVVVPFYSTSSKQQLKYIIDETGMGLLFVGNNDQYEKALWLLENTESLKKIVVFDPQIASNHDKSIDWRDFCQSGAESNRDNDLARVLKEASPDDIATIIYTSGTTGDSKGVIIDHKTLMYVFKIHDDRLSVTENDISVSFLPLSHVFERTWTYYMLYRGAINAFIVNPREIIKYLPIIKPSLMCTVPRFFEKTYEGIQAEMVKWPSAKRKIFNWSIATGHRFSEHLSKNQPIPTWLKIKRGIANKLVLAKLRGIFGGNIKFMPCAGAAINPKLLRFFHAAGIFINYGYGATETSATVSCFRSDVYDFDTCGTVMPGVAVKISDEGEILISGNTIFQGYYKKPDETRKVLIDGWYHSGDKGYLTEKGDLVMVDRIKDLIKTSVGKYVSPQKLELLLCQDSLIEQVVIIGDNRKFVSALVVPAFDTLKVLAQNMNIGFADNTQLISKPEIIAIIQERINNAQQELTDYEKVVKFILLPEPLSIQSGTLTNTLKVKRKMLMEKYSEEIDKLYLSF